MLSVVSLLWNNALMLMETAKSYPVSRAPSRSMTLTEIRRLLSVIFVYPTIDQLNGINLLCERKHTGAWQMPNGDVTYRNYYHSRNYIMVSHVTILSSMGPNFFEKLYQ